MAELAEDVRTLHRVAWIMRHEALQIAGRGKSHAAAQLVEMVGHGPTEGIILIAATNRPDVLDPALLRPGRFDRHITVDRPDVRGREAILRIKSNNKPLAESVNLKTLATLTSGMSGVVL